MMERISLLVVSFALFSLGAYEVVTWPAWGLNGTPLFLLLGRMFRQLYAGAEIVSATIFAIFGIFGVYFVAAGPESRHTGRFEALLLYPLSVLFFSSVGFVVLGSELLAHNSFLAHGLEMIWKWRWRSGRKATLALIEEEWICCGWSDQNRYSSSPHCKQFSAFDDDLSATCDTVVMTFSGKAIYRQGLLLATLSLLMLVLMLLLVWMHQDDPLTRDIEDAESLEDRRKKLYSGHCPAIQLE